MSNADKSDEARESIVGHLTEQDYVKLQFQRLFGEELRRRWKSITAVLGVAIGILGFFGWQLSNTAHEAVSKAEALNADLSMYRKRFEATMDSARIRLETLRKDAELYRREEDLKQRGREVMQQGREVLAKGFESQSDGLQMQMTALAKQVDANSALFERTRIMVAEATMIRDSLCAMLRNADLMIKELGKVFVLDNSSLEIGRPRRIIAFSEQLTFTLVEEGRIRFEAPGGEIQTKEFVLNTEEFLGYKGYLFRVLGTANKPPYRLLVYLREEPL